MKIGKLRNKIKIQSSTISADSIGNRIATWTDYYTCHATISGEGGNEVASARIVTDRIKADFTVRYCSALDSVTSEGYRIQYDGKIFNIEGIDHFNDEHKMVKIMCSRERR